MGSRTYKFLDFKLVTAKAPHPPLLTKDDVPVDTAGDMRLRIQDLRVLQHMVVETATHKATGFTVEELWQVGWWDRPNDKAATETTIKNGVRGAVSRLRHNLPDVFPKEGYWIVPKIEDKTPMDPSLLTAHRILIAATITVMVTVLIDTPARALFATFDLTITEPIHLTRTLGAILGAFQGVFGALIYSLPIVTSLLTLWFVASRYEPHKIKLAALVSTTVGGAAGIVGGSVISAALMFAQHVQTLQDANWISKGSNDRWEAFTTTRLGYSGPWYGLVIGIAVSFTVLTIVRRPSWKEFLKDNPSLTNPSIALRVFTGLFIVSLRWCAISVLLPMLLAAAVFCRFVPSPAPIGRIVGESIVIATGGFAFVSGLLIALYSLTKGADISGDEKCSLIP